MKIDKKSMQLYIVTDRTWLGNNSFLEQIEDTLRAGATFLQLREKDMSDAEFLAEAIDIKKITEKYNVPFVINDNIKVAIESNADGVHVGQSDMSPSLVSKTIGYDNISGVSAHTVSMAIKAEREGADYIGVGAVFSTSTKTDTNSVSVDTLKEICNSVNIPVVAIGGINKNNILHLKGTGIDGVAVISAIFAKPDIFQATKIMLELAKEAVYSD